MTISAIGAAVAALLVVGIPLSAAAALRIYWDGTTVQNQVKFSPTATMFGGYVETRPANGVYTAVATVSGVGTFSAPGSVTYSHATRNTYVYCQWRFAVPISDQVRLVCMYEH